MTELKLSQQITFLRKSRQLTQEKLAAVLGVTNQTVSKWESAQCCPDIALLPRIAEFFGVSVDTLLGCGAPSASDPADAQEDCAASALQNAALMHLHVLSCLCDGNDPRTPLFRSASAKAHAADGSWGYSCLCSPKLTTTMRGGTVFFSDNRLPQHMDAHLHRLSALLRSFSDINVLKTAAALYRLTVEDECVYAPLRQIADEAALPPETVRSLLQGALFPYLTENSEGYRLAGMYMNLLPVLSLLDFQ